MAKGGIKASCARKVEVIRPKVFETSEVGRFPCNKFAGGPAKNGHSMTMTLD